MVCKHNSHILNIAPDMLRCYTIFFKNYLVSLVVYQIGVLITAGTFGVGTVVAFLIIAFFLYMLFRPNKNKVIFIVFSNQINQ